MSVFSQGENAAYFKIIDNRSQAWERRKFCITGERFGGGGIYMLNIIHYFFSLYSDLFNLLCNTHRHVFVYDPPCITVSALFSA